MLIVLKKQIRSQLSKVSNQIKEDSAAAHLLDEDLGDVAVVVERGQMQRGEAVLLLDVHQLPRPAQDLLCGPATGTTKTTLIKESAQLSSRLIA